MDEIYVYILDDVKESVNLKEPIQIESTQFKFSYIGVDYEKIDRLFNDGKDNKKQFIIILDINMRVKIENCTHNDGGVCILNYFRKTKKYTTLPIIIHSIYPIQKVKKLIGEFDKYTLYVNKYAPNYNEEIRQCLLRLNN